MLNIAMLFLAYIVVFSGLTVHLSFGLKKGNLIAFWHNYYYRDLNIISQNSACVNTVKKVRKAAKIKNRYNQVPHLSQDTEWESNKITINLTNKGQKVSLFPSGDLKAALNRCESMANTIHK